MPDAFTHYWRNDSWNDPGTRAREGKPLDCIGGTQFIERGVQVGDWIYIITAIDGKLYLCGRMVVSRITNHAEAERFVGRQLFEFPEYLLTTQGTRRRFDRRVPDDVVERLRFGAVGAPPTFDTPGKLNQQTVRGLRRLTPESAALLDQLLSDDSGSEGLPDIDEGYTAFEGTPYLREHLRHERNRQIVDLRKETAWRTTGRLACEVCGFDFAEAYGERGEGLIECHHKKAVSQLRKGEPTTLDDLALVCCNCHRVLHRGADLLTIEALRRIRRRQGGRKR